MDRLCREEDLQFSFQLAADCPDLALSTTMSKEALLTRWDRESREEQSYLRTVHGSSSMRTRAVLFRAVVTLRRVMCHVVKRDSSRLCLLKKI
jgi:hypothetical protein